MAAIDPILQELFDATRGLLSFRVGDLPDQGFIRDCDPARAASARLAMALDAFERYEPGKAAPDFGLYLDLSTAHVTQGTRNMLDLGSPADWPLPGHKGEYGWFLFAPDAETRDEEPLPKDLDEICRYVRSRGVTHFLLDADARIDPSLTTYET